MIPSLTSMIPASQPGSTPGAFPVWASSTLPSREEPAVLGVMGGFRGGLEWGLRVLDSLKLTASLHLKMDGWNTIVSFWDGLFSGASC